MARLLLILLFLPYVISANPKRELRAAWIATVFNIDWPSAKNLPREQQKNELLSLLDTLEALKFNAAILQVKPTSDAFYASKLSPWSQFLTGKQGKNPGYDPLAFFIEEAQKRNLETHVWVNPYRVLNEKGGLRSLSPNHIALKNKSWVIEYNHRLYFDPGNPQVQDYVIKEILEIVKDYDIDVLHMDDYFYPYTVYHKGKPVDFGDDASWEKYGKGKFKDKGDWRRDNVNTFVKRLSEEIKKTKPHVKFGISPFGVWRNKSEDPRGSDTRAGQTNYDHLYADVLLWIKEKWIDYVMPQIYWHFDSKPAPYDVLVKWWKEHVADQVNLYIGIGVYKVRDQRWPSSHIREQVEYARKNNTGGVSHYSMTMLQENTRNISNEIAKNIYQNHALVPINKNVEPIIPIDPQNFKATTNNQNIRLTWKNGDVDHTRYFLLYRFNKDEKEFNDSDSKYILAKISAKNKLQFEITNFNPQYTYAISSVSRLHYESGVVPLEKTELADALDQIDTLVSEIESENS
ncbi:MAG: glycoside hydrolase family 10 protein [Brevinema sp.]